MPHVLPQQASTCGFIHDDAAMNELSSYEPKILVALGEAIDGNYEIHKWLLENDYPELAALASSLQADIDAFQWLMKNGFNHFAAFSNAIDEDTEAYKWLARYEFRLLVLMVDAAYLNPSAIEILKKEKLELLLRIALKIRKLKEAQHLDYNFYYKMHF